MIRKPFDLGKFTEYNTIPDQYTATYIRSAKVVKVCETDTIVTIAIADSMLIETGKFIESFHEPKKTEFISVPDSIFSEFIGNVIEVDAEHLNNTDFSTVDDKDFSLDAISSSSPVINIINAICLEAIRRNASDIHIQPLDTCMHIRFRLDGVLHTIKTLPKSIFSTIVQRIKVMAHLDITEQRQPQDGRMSVTIQNELHNLRVSIVPVVYGESIVLRFFNIQGSVMTLDNLGFYPRDLSLLQRAVSIPNGLILATGPTGSGKTTTLHALLQRMDKEQQNIITIEDPIERILPGINQIQVNYNIDLTFNNILRRVLRQDPNIIMVGEIRDTETAELALRAALTGHIIFSTLHTNDSISAISRLANMGIEYFLIASVIRYIIAQRLVRKLCPECRKKIATPPFLKKLQKKYKMQSDFVYEEQGCEHCNFTGYSGRTVIAEIFTINNDIERMIANKNSIFDLSNYANTHGMVTLEACAVSKVTDGITTINEILREALICNTDV